MKKNLHKIKYKNTKCKAKRNKAIQNLKTNNNQRNYNKNKR